MRIVVTGGCGFIGTNFIRAINADVLNIDKLTYCATPGDRLEVDITSPEAREAILDYRPEAIVHMAAESHVERSVWSPAAFVESNIVGTFKMLETARELAALDDGFRFIHVSTDEVWGSIDVGMFTEQSPYRPNSPYAATKAAADHLVRAWGETYDVPVIITHCSNNYGPYQYPDKLIPRTINRVLCGVPIQIHGDGKHVRDWLHVDDHVRGLLMVLEKGEPGERYCFGGDGERTNIDVVRRIVAHLRELDPKITFVADRKSNDRRYAVDYTETTEKLGWTPEISFDEGLKQTIEWYRRAA